MDDSNKNLSLAINFAVEHLKAQFSSIDSIDTKGSALLAASLVIIALLVSTTGDHLEQVVSFFISNWFSIAAVVCLVIGAISLLLSVIFALSVLSTRGFVSFPSPVDVVKNEKFEHDEVLRSLADDFAKIHKANYECLYWKARRLELGIWSFAFAVVFSSAGVLFGLWVTY